MIRKILTALRLKRDNDHPVNTLLHNAAPRAQPPKGLLDRIEKRLDSNLARRKDQQKKLLILFTAVSCLALIGLFAFSISPTGYLVVDAMGKPIVRIEVAHHRYMVSGSSLKPIDQGAYHLWAIPPSGPAEYIAALRSEQQILPPIPKVNQFAISLEGPGFSGAQPVGPVIATSRCDNFFCRALHPN